MSQRYTKEELEFSLNGLSVHTLQLSQDGELEIQFDLPYRQSTARYQSQLRGIRTLNVYEDGELQEACRRLFAIVRRRVMEPDRERLEIDCDRCGGAGCCRRYNVLVTDEDIERLSRRLGYAQRAFRERYTTPAVDWSHDYERQLACDLDGAGEEKCVFLRRASNGQHRCSVYEDRPRICRDFDVATCSDFGPLKNFVPIESVSRPARPVRA